MIDFHILYTRTEHFRQCLNSLADYKHVHVIANLGRTILEGRLIGYELGDQPYVAQIDDDDVMTRSYEDCLDLARLGKTAVFTNSHLLVDDKIIETPFVDRRHKEWTLKMELVDRSINPHQLAIIERDLAKYATREAARIIKEESWPHSCADRVILTVVSVETGWHYVPEYFYHWRRHPNSATGKQLTKPHEWEAINAYFKAKATLRSLI